MRQANDVGMWGKQSSARSVRTFYSKFHFKKLTGHWNQIKHKIQSLYQDHIWNGAATWNYCTKRVLKLVFSFFCMSISPSLSLSLSLSLSIAKIYIASLTSNAEIDTGTMTDNVVSVWTWKLTTSLPTYLPTYLSPPYLPTRYWCSRKLKFFYN